MNRWHRIRDWGTRVSAPHGTWLRRVFALLRAALAEIFDEAAYRRFLQRQCRLPSAAAYAAFLREQEFAKARRPRCC